MAVAAAATALLLPDADEIIPEELGADVGATATLPRKGLAFAEGVRRMRRADGFGAAPVDGPAPGVGSNSSLSSS